MPVPPFDISQYGNHRQAVIALLVWLQKQNKAVTAAFVVEWYNLGDHQGVQRILKALDVEGHVSVQQQKRAGRALLKYRLKPGRNPDKPTPPNKNEMVWSCLQSAGSPLTVAEIALVTGVGKETVSSFIQRLHRGGLVENAGQSTGDPQRGRGSVWRLPKRHASRAAPKTRTVNGRKQAVLEDA